MLWYPNLCMHGKTYLYGMLFLLFCVVQTNMLFTRTEKKQIVWISKWNWIQSTNSSPKRRHKRIGTSHWSNFPCASIDKLCCCFLVYDDGIHWFEQHRLWDSMEPPIWPNWHSPNLTQQRKIFHFFLFWLVFKKGIKRLTASCWLRMECLIWEIWKNKTDSCLEERWKRLFTYLVQHTQYHKKKQEAMVDKPTTLCCVNWVYEAEDFIAIWQPWRCFLPFLNWLILAF